jgi:hypothetical protein
MLPDVKKSPLQKLKIATETQNSQKFSRVNFCDFCVFVVILPFLQYSQKKRVYAG